MATTAVTDAEIEEIVDRLEQVALNAVESALRRDGSVQPPVVHMIVATQPGAYVGLIESRSFHRGADAASAIRQMGFLPAAMYATRLVVTWEHLDMCVALGEGGAGAQTSTAQLVLDARRDGTHTMRRHPFTILELDDLNLLMAPVVPRWGPMERIENARLPEPVEELLALWRKGFNPLQLAAIHDQLVRAGYSVQLYTQAA